MTNFTAALNDTNSAEFKSLAKNIEDALLPALQKVQIEVERIEVNFGRGSRVELFLMRGGSKLESRNPYRVLDVNGVGVNQWTFRFPFCVTVSRKTKI